MFKVEGIGQKKDRKMQENWEVHIQYMVAPLKAVKKIVYLLNIQSTSHIIRGKKQKCTLWFDNALELVAYGIRQEKENRIIKLRRKIITY